MRPLQQDLKHTILGNSQASTIKRLGVSPPAQLGGHASLLESLGLFLPNLEYSRDPGCIRHCALHPQLGSRHTSLPESMGVSVPM